MARNSVEINGVILTRKQLEEAVKKLNEPENYKPGTKLRTRDSGSAIYIVVDVEATAGSTALKSLGCDKRDYYLLLDISSGAMHVGTHELMNRYYKVAEN
jgi:hypothetical protein